jgi:hypothetical protein
MRNIYIAVDTNSGCYVALSDEMASIKRSHFQTAANSCLLNIARPLRIHLADYSFPDAYVSFAHPTSPHFYLTFTAQLQVSTVL